MRWIGTRFIWTVKYICCVTTGFLLVTSWFWKFSKVLFGAVPSERMEVPRLGTFPIDAELLHQIVETWCCLIRWCIWICWIGWNTACHEAGTIAWMLPCGVSRYIRVALMIVLYFRMNGESTPGSMRAHDSNVPGRNANGRSSARAVDNTNYGVKVEIGWDAKVGRLARYQVERLALAQEQIQQQMWQVLQISHKLYLLRFASDA